MSEESLTESSVVVASDHTTSAKVEEESVILDLNQGVYYSLNASGSRVWEGLQEPAPISKITSDIVDEYNVSYDECLEDVLYIIQDLKSSGLVEIRS